ncbi:MAG: hypothetical protein B7Z72_00495 [Gemmatimonadetes bacterium 21-71-4]|nr:MAG: hypothetical protein B7Z72_00495 [Gemmatimonadetes bacterium 21-71-4]
MVLVYVWRVQDLLSPLGAAKPGIVVTGVVVVLAMLDGPVLARLNAFTTWTPARFALLMGMLAIGFAPWSLFPKLSLSMAGKDLMPAIALMGLLAASIREPRDVYRFVAVEVLGAVVFAGVVLTRYHVGPNGRLGSLVYYDANDLGMFLVCTLPLADWWRRRARHFAVRLAAAAAIAVLLVTIIRTGSRGAFLGLLAVVLYAVIGYRSVPLARRVAMAAVCAGLLALAAGTTYWATMDTILHPTSDYNWIGNAEGGRMDVWRRGIGYMMHRPVTGVGLGAFPVAEGTLSPLASQQQWGVGVKWSVAHNSFVQAGAELGVLGLAAFVGLLASAFRLARRTAAFGRATGDESVSALGDALCATFVGYAVAGFFLSQAYAAYLFVMVGIALGLARAVSVGDAAPAVATDREAPRIAAGRTDAPPSLEWLRDQP